MPTACKLVVAIDDKTHLVPTVIIRWQLSAQGTRHREGKEFHQVDWLLEEFSNYVKRPNEKKTNVAREPSSSGIV